MTFQTQSRHTFSPPHHIAHPLPFPIPAMACLCYFHITSYHKRFVHALLLSSTPSYHPAHPFPTVLCSIHFSSVPPDLPHHMQCDVHTITPPSDLHLFPILNSHAMSCTAPCSPHHTLYFILDYVVPCHSYILRAPLNVHSVFSRPAYFHTTPRLTSHVVSQPFPCFAIYSHPSPRDLLPLSKTLRCPFAYSPFPAILHHSGSLLSFEIRQHLTISHQTPSTQITHTVSHYLDL
jgi:hypothetical protein